jgi:hypothetical protein
MGIDRGTYFHSLYRLQHKLGRVFRELQPYGLYPVSEYFASKLDKSTLAVMPVPRKPKPVQPPLRKSA